MKNLSKPLPPISSRKPLCLFSGVVLAALLVSCDCTKGYLMDRKKEADRNAPIDSDSSYFIIGELVQERFGTKRFLLKIHGSDYAGLEQGQKFVRSLDLSKSTLYWNDVGDSLRFVKTEGNSRYYAIDGASLNRYAKLQMDVYFGKKDAADEASLTKKHYVLKRFKNCRAGLH